MESDGNDNEPLTAPVSTMDDDRGESSYNNTIDDGPGSTCDDGASDWKRWVNVESTIAVPTSDSDSQWSAIESALELSDGETDLQNGRARNADGTFVWDPQETCAPLLESTVWPLGSALLATTAYGTEAVAGFEILSELGHGGMGIVYKARHLRLKRLVALKVIRYGRHRNPEDLARFQIEAEVVARLNHPNIVRIYEIGKAGRVPFVALELLEGGTLKDRLAGTPQPLRETAVLLCTLARAIHAAHVEGVLHRDIKPSNVLFDRDGTPKIADFGLAKRMDVEEGETITGQVIGTPSYMAPEQAQGWAPEIGHAADIYSLGAILYEMLTGRPPIKGETQAETLKLVLEEEPVSPSQLRPKVSFDLETICLKCIARDPRKRYASALSLAEDLARFLEGEPILARRTPFWERADKLAQRHKVIASAMASGIVAIGLAVSLFLHDRKRENDRVWVTFQDVQQKLLEAQDALATGKWTEVRRMISGLQSQIEKETDDRFSSLRLAAVGLDRRAVRGLASEEGAERVRAQTEQVRAQLGGFRENLDTAKFLDTRFGGLEPGNALEATCRAARAGLGIFGAGGGCDEWALGPLPAQLTFRERDEVTNGFYELLLILADAVAQSPRATPEKQAERALRIIDQVPRARSAQTRAFHLRRSAYLEMKGDREGAARERKTADRLAPADAFDLFLIGRDLALKGDWKAAITNLEAATQKQPNHFWAQCLLAISHLQNHEPDTARVGLTACLQQKPECAWLYLLRGLANSAEGKLARDIPQLYSVPSASLSKIAAGHFDAALADYRIALELLGNSPSASLLHYVLLVNRGHIQIERGDLTAAAADLREAIRRNDRRFEAFSGLAHVLQRQGQAGPALEQLELAIRIQPNLAELHRARADLLLAFESSAPDLRDVVLHDLEDEIRNLSSQRRDDAMRALETAIRYESPGKGGIALDKIRQAVLFHVGGRNREALEACNAALASVPRLALAHQLRIQVLLDLREYDNLIQSVDRALEYVNRSAELYELRGMAKDGLEDYSGAVDDYTVSLSLGADNARVHRRRGWSYLAQDALRPAALDFDAAVAAAPKCADAYAGRGLTRARLLNHADAVRDADQALELGQGNSRITLNAARVYAQAAVAADTESRKTGPVAVRVVRRYLDRAVELARLALERAPQEQRAQILNETILKDPMLEPIARRLK